MPNLYTGASIDPYSEIADAQREWKREVLDNELGLKANFILEQKGDSFYGMIDEHEEERDDGHLYISGTGSIPTSVGRDRRIRIAYANGYGGDPDEFWPFDMKQNLEESGTRSIIYLGNQNDILDDVVDVVDDLYHETVQEASGKPYALS